MRKILVSTLLSLVLASTSAGCFGKFALTRKIYGFNAGVSHNKVVRSIVMWAMIIIPVYEVGGLVDFWIINPIEFITGKNPVAANDQGDAAARLAAVEQPDGSVTFEHGAASYRVVPSGAGGFVVERDGTRVGTAEITDDGGLLVSDAQGDVIEALSAAEVDARAADAAVLAVNR